MQRSSYKKEFLFWAYVEALKKLLLVGVARVIMPGTTAQLSLAIFYMVFSQMLLLMCRPYKRGEQSPDSLSWSAGVKEDDRLL